MKTKLTVDQQIRDLEDQLNKLISTPGLTIYCVEIIREINFIRRQLAALTKQSILE